MAVPDISLAAMMRQSSGGASSAGSRALALAEGAANRAAQDRAFREAEQRRIESDALKGRLEFEQLQQGFAEEAEAVKGIAVDPDNPEGQEAVAPDQAAVDAKNKLTDLALEIAALNEDILAFSSGNPDRAAEYMLTRFGAGQKPVV